MRETLDKLKVENQSLKQDLFKKQAITADRVTGDVDPQKYHQEAETNLRLKQSVEDLQRRELELKSRL